MWLSLLFPWKHGLKNGLKKQTYSIFRETLNASAFYISRVHWYFIISIKKYKLITHIPSPVLGERRVPVLKGKLDVELVVD